MMRRSQTATNAKLFWIAGQIVTCESKRAFPKKRNAYASADMLGLKLTVYRCPVCNYFHLTKGIIK